MADQQNERDGYEKWRVKFDGMRLNYQHFVWREHLGYNLHPSINLPAGEDIRIADVAAGHCLWSLQVAQQLGPNCHIEASDLTLSLAPPKFILPSNIRLRTWNFFDPVPEDWIGSFDIVHARLIVAGFSNGKDPKPVLAKFASMLKPGGYLQWDEYTYEHGHKGYQYIADPERFPDPQTSHPANFELCQNLIESFKWDASFFDHLPEHFASVGLETVVQEQKQTNPSTARAFFEYMTGGFITQMIDLYDKIDPDKAREQRKLAEQVYRDWDTDGIMFIALPNIVVGRKGLDSAS